MDLFEYIEKWQSSESYWSLLSNVPEDDPTELVDKLQNQLGWVDELPLLAENRGNFMTDAENLAVLVEWCFIQNI